MDLLHEKSLVTNIINMVKLMNLDSLEKYKMTAVKTSDVANQMLFVFDESIKLLHLAKKALDEKNYGLKHQLLIKIVDVFMMLRSGSNTETEETVILLDKFYETAITKLHQININSVDSGDINVVIDSIKQVRDSIQESQARAAQNK